MYVSGGKYTQRPTKISSGKRVQTVNLNRTSRDWKPSLLSNENYWNWPIKPIKGFNLTQDYQ